MNKRKLLALLFMGLAIVFGAIFLVEVDFPKALAGYFEKSYYQQFGPIAISVELLVAGFYLFTKHQKANFTLALFAFTALLDPLFNLTGIFTSLVPIYATIIFVCCALVAIWLTFTNAFSLGKISIIGAFGSFILGTAVELFFNYL